MALVLAIRRDTSGVLRLDPDTLPGFRRAASPDGTLRVDPDVTGGTARRASDGTLRIWYATYTDSRSYALSTSLETLINRITRSDVRFDIDLDISRNEFYHQSEDFGISLDLSRNDIYSQAVEYGITLAGQPPQYQTSVFPATAIWRDASGSLRVDSDLLTGLYRRADGALAVNTDVAVAIYRKASPDGALVSWWPTRVRSANFATSLSLVVPTRGTAQPITLTYEIGLSMPVAHGDRALFILYPLKLTPARNRVVDKTISRNLTVTARTPKISANLVRVLPLAVSLVPNKFPRLTLTRSGQLAFLPVGEVESTATEVLGRLARFESAMRGARGAISLSYRVVRSNILGEELGNLSGHIKGTGSVSMSNFRDHAWEASFDWLENDTIDPARDYIKIYADLEIPGEAKVSYPLGLYKLAKPSGVIAETHTVRSINGRSLEWLLARDGPDAPYGIPAGQDALVWAQGVITYATGLGADRVLFPAVSAPLRYALQFDDAQDSEGATWLAIVNELLNAAGYYALQTDAQGQFVTEKMGSQTVLEPHLKYDEEYQSAVTRDISDDWNDDRFANKIRVVNQDVAETPPMVAIAKNTNPSSHGSIDYLGETVRKTINLQAAVSLAEMQVMAQAELEKASGYYRKLTITHLFDPRAFAPRRVYGLLLTDQDGYAMITGRWNQVNCNVRLSKPAEPMTSEVSSIETI